MTVPIIIDTYPLSTGYASMNIRYLLLVFTLMVVEVNADSSTLDAAIGGGIGGAAGAAIGNEIGGRDGAIVGGALGGAIGAAVNTDEESQYSSPHRKMHYRDSHPLHEHPGSRFCPPGQAKKGHC
jgi:phage tail tape-measure protein